MATLLVDAGGTNIRTAFTDREQGIWGEQTQAANEFENLTYALQTRCQEHRVQPDTAIIAVAGPVISDQVKFTNRSWNFSQQQLKKVLQLKQLVVMNDFAAVALALPILTPAHLEVIRSGNAPERTTMLAIGPGTGLGISCVVPTGNSWLVIPGEGGHCTAALDRLVPIAAQQRLWDSGWLPWEAILSGPGLVRLHTALHCTNALDTPEKITSAAASGDENASQTLSCFAALLGRRASDAAMDVGAWGGVFLAGGVIKSMGNLFDRDAFRKGFETKGASSDLVRRIGVSLITDPYPAFTGLNHAASINYSDPGQIRR
jgi:glucokinase